MIITSGQTREGAVQVVATLDRPKQESEALKCYRNGSYVGDMILASGDSYKYVDADVQDYVDQTITYHVEVFNVGISTTRSLDVDLLVSEKRIGCEILRIESAPPPVPVTATLVYESVDSKGHVVLTISNSNSVALRCRVRGSISDGANADTPTLLSISPIGSPSTGVITANGSLVAVPSMETAFNLAGAELIWAGATTKDGYEGARVIVQPESSFIMNSTIGAIDVGYSAQFVIQSFTLDGFLVGELEIADSIGIGGV